MRSKGKLFALSLLACIGLPSCGPSAAPEPQPFPITVAALGTIGVSPERARPEVAECEVHHVPLEEATVAIIYGIPYMGSSEYYEARAADFPYACSKVAAGCGGGPVSMQVRRCSQCTEAELAWKP